MYYIERGVGADSLGCRLVCGVESMDVSNAKMLAVLVRVFAVISCSVLGFVNVI